MTNRRNSFTFFPLYKHLFLKQKSMRSSFIFYFGTFHENQRSNHSSESRVPESTVIARAQGTYCPPHPVY